MCAVPSTTTAEQKAALRARLRAEMGELTPEARRRSDDALFARFLALPEIAEAGTILLYHGMGAEPETARLLPVLWAAGKRVALPRCTGPGTMEARLAEEGRPLIRHRFGMLEPGEDAPRLEPEELDLILVPGLAFDRSGGRLGQGGGFYDRYLPRCTGVTAALCRGRFLLPEVPRAEHDQRVDLVVTEEAVFRLSKRAEP